MSTPAAAAAAVTTSPAADTNAKSSDSSSASVSKPAREGVIGEVSKEVSSEITQDGMRIESNWSQVVTSFDDMNLKDELLRGIYAYGFEKPSAIQQRGSVTTLTLLHALVRALGAR